MMETARLIETVKLAQAGDEKAQQDLYIDASKNIYYLALKMLRNHAAAEDATQDIFITVFEKIHELREPAAYYRWLRTIAVHKCSNMLSKKTEFLGAERDEAEQYDVEDDDILALPDKAYDDAETRALIMEVIDGLPDAQRTCIYSYYYQQLPVAEIAWATQANENTVKKRLALGREKVKQALLQKEREEGIKLYTAPLALTPILLKALEEFAMPQGLAESMWLNIAEGAGIAAGGTAVATAASEAAQLGTQGAVQGGAQAGGQPPTAQGGVQNGTPNAPDAPSNGSAPSHGNVPQTSQPQGEMDMNNPNNHRPQQSNQNPQGQPPHYQQPPQQPYQPQQGSYPQGQQPYSGQQPGQYPQQGYPQQGWQQPQPYNAVPQGAPGTPPTPPPTMGAAPIAQAAGATAAKAGMAAGTKVALSVMAVVTAAALTVAGIFVVPRLTGDAGDGGTSTQGENGAIGENNTPIQDGFAEEHTVTLVTDDGTEYQGTYEGEYKGGLFSGYGIWVYQNFRYEGYFENGLPNGEGTLYHAILNIGYTYLRTTEANWIDGLADGNMTHTWYWDNGDISVWAINMSNGYPASDQHIVSTNDGRRYHAEVSDVHGVPPWAPVETDPSVPAPSGSGE